MRIPVFNPETTSWEKSYLANPYSVGTTTIVVKNADRFAASQRIMLGEMGTEAAEIVTVQSIAADNITVTLSTPTLYPHSADDPVTVMVFDSVRYYRSTDSGTTYALLTTQPMDVDNVTLETLYDDTTGLTTYYYYFTFYHSVSTLESGNSDPIKGTGWRREQVGYIIDEILLEISDPGEVHMTRGELLGYFNDVNDDLTINVSKPYDFLHSRLALTRTANRNYLDFPVDADGKQIMWKFDYMDYNFTDSTTTPVTNNTYTLTVMPEPEFRNTYQNNTIDSTTVSDDLQVMCLDTSVNRFRFDKPAATTAATAFYLHYWKYFNVIDSEGDVIETPTAKIYKLYCKAMYYQKRTIADVTLASTAQLWDQKYIQEKGKYVTVNRKDKGTPRSFRPLTSTIKGYRR